MKRHLFFIRGVNNKKNEKGVVLPYVLFIATLVFIIVTASIRTYEMGIEITSKQIDQINIETLVQMGLGKFKEEYIPNELNTLTVNYTFPAGDVTINSEKLDKLSYRLHFTITTVNQSVYTIYHMLQVLPEE